MNSKSVLLGGQDSAAQKNQDSHRQTTSTGRWCCYPELFSTSDGCYLVVNCQSPVYT